ncbi:unnamed protein product [Gongylonema pulchrum]|uniref:Uncharacterized protein n=1 Tax=Gongylonema pulchrum TaxID=637853 RepID=A0A183EKH6_9BILA|nr:unnamed protein product [Gongylonema pulchrum]
MLERRVPHANPPVQSSGLVSHVTRLTVAVTLVDTQFIIRLVPVIRWHSVSRISLSGATCVNHMSTMKFLFRPKMQHIAPNLVFRIRNMRHPQKTVSSNTTDDSSFLTAAPNIYILKYFDEFFFFA